MSKLFAIAISSLLMTGCWKRVDESSAVGPAEVFVDKQIDYGRFTVGSQAQEVQVAIHNRTHSSVVIDEIETSCGCAAIGKSDLVLAAGERGSIQVELSRSVPGERAATISLRTKGQGGKATRESIQCTWRCEPLAVFEPAAIHLQRYEPGQTYLVEVAYGLTEPIEGHAIQVHRNGIGLVATHVPDRRTVQLSGQVSKDEKSEGFANVVLVAQGRVLAELPVRVTPLLPARISPQRISFGRPEKNAWATQNVIAVSNRFADLAFEVEPQALGRVIDWECEKVGAGPLVRFRVRRVGNEAFAGKLNVLLEGSRVGEIAFDIQDGVSQGEGSDEP
jgi:hypothetical protein